MQFSEKCGALECRNRGELLRIEAWGKDSIRVRATMFPGFTGQDWALTEKTEPSQTEILYGQDPHRESDGSYRQMPYAMIRNGRIAVKVNHAGVMTLYRDGKLLLQEYYRNYGGSVTRESHCLKRVNREWTPYQAGDYQLVLRFEPNEGEKIFGMGQYQQPWLDLKGCSLELAQKNSQTSIPFAVSSLGYGFLWNNPAVGSVAFARNITEWTASACKEMDYWVTVGENPRTILQNYTAVTGRAPMMNPEYMGFWQSKLRYRTQEEVLQVARKYHSMGIKPDVIVVDFFHWTVQGDWKFDPVYWPDPKAMVEELHSMGIKVMVSVWPSVDRRSEHFEEMEERGLLIRTERGAMQTYDYQGDCGVLDATNPETREYVWNILKKNYLDYGFDCFWLDNSEPDLCKYDFDHFRYWLGPAMECSNIYPQWYSRMVYDHEIREGIKDPVNLLRSGWAGSQKYGNVLWSGDIPSTWEAFRDQLAAGLNMGLSGIAWWNTDIGGFMEGNVFDPDFPELLARWYEWAVFGPILRLHGDREPFTIPALDNRTWGGGYLHTGQGNEMWSYGPEIQTIMIRGYQFRKTMQPYIESLFRECHESGAPLLRTMFFEFPEDPVCWEISDQYMFGAEYLVAPVLWPQVRSRNVYLPNGIWEDIRDGKRYQGACTVQVPAPLDSIPVFKRYPPELCSKT